MSPRQAFAIAALLLLSPAQVAAEADEVVQSKSYFKAGAAAYEMGDYLAAIQALEAAYRLTPLPAIAFSLAQAERRQYFASREPTLLMHAIELFRKYLQEVTTGGRRADATDALGQLEPLAIANTPASSTVPDTTSAPEKTRLMITCDAPRAAISLDDAAPAPSPLIAQVAPGPHKVSVTARGFYPTARAIDAVAGALIPLEIALRAQPAVVLVRTEPDADLHVDGSFIGRLSRERRLELAGGSHRLTFARAGYDVKTVEAQFPPGTTRKIAVDLDHSAQRSAALALLVGSGVSTATAAVFTALAVDRENAATAFLTNRGRANVSAVALRDYTHALEQRDRFRLGAIAGFTVSAAALITGLCLYALDEPDLTEPSTRPSAPHAPELHVALPGPGDARRLALDARFHF